MLRRKFLSGAALASGAFFLQLDAVAKAVSLPADVEFNGNRYRTAGHGRIDVSADGGKSWQLHADFGADFAIVGLAEDRGRMRARLVSDASRFELALTRSGKAWMTA